MNLSGVNQDTNQDVELMGDDDIVKGENGDYEDDGSIYTNFLYNTYGKVHIGDLNKYYHLKNKFDMNRYNINKAKAKILKMKMEMKLVSGRENVSNTDKKTIDKHKKLVGAMARIKKRLQKNKESFTQTPDILDYTKKGKQIENIKRIRKENIHNVLAKMNNEIKEKEKQIFLNKYDFLFDFNVIEDPVSTFEKQITDYESALKEKMELKAILDKQHSARENKLNEIETRYDHIRQMLKTEKDPENRRSLYESYAKLMKEKYMLKKKSEIENVVEVSRK